MRCKGCGEEANRLDDDGLCPICAQFQARRRHKGELEGAERLRVAAIRISRHRQSLFLFLLAHLISVQL